MFPAHAGMDRDIECEDGVRIIAKAMRLSGVDEWAEGRHFEQCGPVVATPEIRFRDLMTNCGRGFERAARPAAPPALTMPESGLEAEIPRRPMFPPFGGISLRQHISEILCRVSLEEAVRTRVQEYLERRAGLATEPHDTPCPECTYAPQGMGCLPTCEHFVCAACEHRGDACVCVPNF